MRSARSGPWAYAAEAYGGNSSWRAGSSGRSVRRSGPAWPCDRRMARTRSGRDHRRPDTGQPCRPAIGGRRLEACMSRSTTLASRVVALGLAATFAGIAYAQTAQEIVEQADKVRNPTQPFRSTLTLTEYVGGKE